MKVGTWRPDKLKKLNQIDLYHIVLLYTHANSRNHESNICNNVVDLLPRLVHVLLRPDHSQPQTQEVILWKRSVEGMNLNFTAVNLNGFIFYSIFSCYGYFINSDQTG